MHAGTPHAQTTQRACLTHLCPKLELVQTLADLVQVLVLLLRLSVNGRSLLPIACISEAVRADTWVGGTAGLALLLLLAVLLHGLRVGRAVWFIASRGWPV